MFETLKSLSSPSERKVPAIRNSKQFREDMKLLSDGALEICLSPEVLQSLAPFDPERQDKYAQIIRQELASRQPKQEVSIKPKRKKTKKKAKK